ncbi:cellulose binding domain-containing protein [Streptomyces montanisoli]|uniref:chitinase n=1 Tax=Streptomyces montanisoli TaxID=2798581 RepID=A0A940MEY3_9ACTN|nr:cellulose binding domain-containing protein [Streptomyces montanisoli]MBP0457876.1 cellulose binding domain-containing protein [Streptomyces montanisoli]
MGNSTHRRTVTTRTKVIGAVVAAGVIGGAGFAVAGSAQAATAGAAYSRTSSWSGGYAGRYVVTNSTDRTLSGWTLEFDLPAGTTLSSLWNGTHTVDGRHVTVKPASWNGDIAPGASVTVGFVTSSPGKAADPTSCLLDSAECSAGGGAAPEPSGRPTKEPTTGTPTAPTGPAASGGGFSPYVDTSLYPSYNLLDTASKTGVTTFNLAFVTSGGGCVPKWGGVSAIGSDGTPGQIDALRAKGGDVRVSFGGASGTELASACSSASDLAAAYGKVIDQYRLTKVDFDVEGAALPDTAAGTRRSQAIAALQMSHPGLDVSFTLPVMPEGLTQAGVDLVSDAHKNGVKIGAVNVMAMDYGASYGGDMGQYAIQAATATQAQIKGVLGLSDAAAWKTVAVTPMIGVNDVSSEKFTVADASKLVDFARSKKLAWLSMWSAARDKQCAGGAKNSADPTCSSLTQQPLEFTKAFGAYE